MLAPLSNYGGGWPLPLPPLPTPMFQGTHCILELIETHICLGRHRRTKCLDKCKTIIVNPFRVIVQYSTAFILERSSLLRMCRNEFNFVQKSP